MNEILDLIDNLNYSSSQGMDGTHPRELKENMKLLIFWQNQSPYWKQAIGYN